MTLVGAMLVFIGASVQAQPAPCTAPPRPPDGVTATVIPAIRGATPGAPPSTPAILTLMWTASPVGPAAADTAPTVYVIEAGTARGASNVAVVETEGTEVTYSTPMPNGTFYVRVKARNACGTSPSSPEAVTRVTGSAAGGKPNPVILLETVRTVRERLGGTNFIRVMGQVRNGWRASEASFIEVTATFEGPDGKAVGTKATYVNGSSRRLKSSRIVTDTVLEPTATGCFFMFADFPATAQVPSVGLVVTFSAGYETEPLRGRVRVESAILQQADGFGDLTVSGQMKNSGDSLTYFNEIWTEAKDAEGKVLECDATYVKGSSVALEAGIATRTGLDPAEVGVFRNSTEAVLASVNGLRHWINWDERDRRRPAAATPLYRALRQRAAAVLETDEQTSSPQERVDVRDALRREVQSIEHRLTSP